MPSSPYLGRPPSKWTARKILSLVLFGSIVAVLALHAGSGGIKTSRGELGRARRGSVGC